MSRKCLSKNVSHLRIFVFKFVIGVMVFTFCLLFSVFPKSWTSSFYAVLLRIDKDVKEPFALFSSSRASCWTPIIGYIYWRGGVRSWPWLLAAPQPLVPSTPQSQPQPSAQHMGLQYYRFRASIDVITRSQSFSIPKRCLDLLIRSLHVSRVQPHINKRIAP